ncbi:EamA-like transporter family protein [compost metagenome]
MPVVTIAASWLILHERLTGTAMVGALLTLAGLVISERKPKPGRAAPYKEAGAGLER